VIQDTSLEAYKILQPKLGSMQNMIYNFLKVYPGSSNLDISRMLQKPINSITPRVKELRCMGLVRFSHYKTDVITNRKVMCWTVINNR
jgi:Mn-dependent DtxR family transcriptional regulator